MNWNLLETLEQLLETWRGVFSQERIFDRVRRLMFGMLVSLRLHLTSNAICATGRQFQDWSADYRVCSQSPWDPHQLFDPILDVLPALLPDPAAPVLVALDDTLLHKTGRKIPGVTIGRDPMSPPFHVNLCYGLRFVQASVLVFPSNGEGAARALPVRFEFAPPAVRPRGLPRNQTQSGPAPPSAEEIAFRAEKKQKRLTRVGLTTITDIRQALDARPELCQRQLIVSGDATYTTRVILQGLPERTTYVGRIRKDAKLCWPLTAEQSHGQGRPRRYGAAAPTPEQILKDVSIPWRQVQCFAAGESREMPIKVLGPLYWRNAGVHTALQLVVIKPLGYRSRKGGKLHYRRPAFLICTDPALPLQTLVQAYVYRWEIECNHRDEKSLLGVGQGQVRNSQAVRRLPQLQVAGYSLLLLASLLTSGFQRGEGEYLPLPKWRRSTPSRRPSLLDMLNLLRDQIYARNLDAPVVNFEDFLRNAPKSVKASKVPLSAENGSTLAA